MTEPVVIFTSLYKIMDTSLAGKARWPLDCALALITEHRMTLAAGHAFRLDTETVTALNPFVTLTEVVKIFREAKRTDILVPEGAAVENFHVQARQQQLRSFGGKETIYYVSYGLPHKLATHYFKDHELKRFEGEK